MPRNPSVTAQAALQSATSSQSVANYPTSYDPPEGCPECGSLLWDGERNAGVDPCTCRACGYSETRCKDCGEWIETDTSCDACHGPSDPQNPSTPTTEPPCTPPSPHPRID